MARAAKPSLTETGRLKALSTAKLDELIEEPVVDAYDESEQTRGFYSMLEEHLATPFAIDMLGVEAREGTFGDGTAIIDPDTDVALGAWPTAGTPTPYPEHLDHLHIEMKPSIRGNPR